MSAAIRAETAEEVDMLVNFRRLSPRMQRAFLRMLREICGGLSVQQAGIGFWMASGMSRTAAEAAVSGVLAGIPQDGGTAPA